MKTFALVLIALGLAILLASCGLIYTASADKETRKLADEYGGVYVFDKKFREEIIQREKEREDYRKNRYNQMEEERERILRTFFTEEEIQTIRDKKQRDRKRGTFKNYYDPVTEKENEIWRDLWDKYPDLMEEKFPQTLSNGCKYFLGLYDASEKMADNYFKKIREYTGDEIYKKIKPYLTITSYYECGDKQYPLTVEVDIPEVVTTYGLYGDEGRGFSLTQSYVRGISGDNIFYLINGKFIKSDEKRFGETK